MPTSEYHSVAVGCRERQTHDRKGAVGKPHFGRSVQNFLPYTRGNIVAPNIRTFNCEKGGGGASKEGGVWLWTRAYRFGSRRTSTDTRDISMMYPLGVRRDNPRMIMLV
jgi:hypothetical protein